MVDREIDVSNRRGRGRPPLDGVAMTNAERIAKHGDLRARCNTWLAHQRWKSCSRSCPTLASLFLGNDLPRAGPTSVRSGASDSEIASRSAPGANGHDSLAGCRTRFGSPLGFVLFPCRCGLGGGRPSLACCRCLASRRAALPRLCGLLTGCELLRRCHRRLPM